MTSSKRASKKKTEQDAFDKWFDTYKPIVNPWTEIYFFVEENGDRGWLPFNGLFFDTNGSDLEFVWDAPPDHIWTLLDCDGETFITPGRHWVNRLGYFICEVPFDYSSMPNDIELSDS